MDSWKINKVMNYLKKHSPFYSPAMVNEKVQAAPDNI